MKLAYVYDACHPWKTGGVQTRLWELGRRLADRGHDVHWYGLHYWDGPAVIEREGITFHGVMPPRELYVDGRRSIPEALRYAAHLVRPLLRCDADVIDCQEFPYFPAFPSKLRALTADTRLLVTWHEVWGEYWYDYLGRKGVFGQAVERLTAMLPDAHLAVSTRTQRDLADLGVADATLVPNGVAIEAIAEVPPADEHVDVLFVGRLIPEKNPGLVVEAVDRLRGDHPDLQAVIAGEGPEADRLARLVADRGVETHVDLRGRLAAHEEVLGLMKAADVLALPSRREGFGITALEALACGTPVVTLDHPDNAARDLVEEGRTGRLCAASGESLAAAITRVREECDERACTEAASAYEWDHIADQAEAAYREVTA